MMPTYHMLILATAITLSLILERITFACVTLVFYLFGHGPDRKSVWFVSSLVQNTTTAVFGVVGACGRVFSFSFMTILKIVIFLFLWGVLYLCARHSSEALISFQEAYNSDVGGSIRLALVTPLHLANMLFDCVVPLWNLVIYCVKTVPTRVLLENVLRDLKNFEKGVEHLALFLEKLVISLVNYVQIIIRPPDSFDPNLRLLDLIGPLAELRLCVSYFLAWLGQVCSVATSVLDILTYPFLDINFGLGIHNTVNSLLQLIIHVPAVTVDRCNAGGGPVVYCLPDFEPVIELMVNGIRNFGMLVDNWLDVTTIIIQSVLTNTSPACSGWMAVDFKASMGNNETTIVGVSPTQFAQTDGWGINLYTRTTMETLPDAFPLAARVDIGIAVVSVSATLKGLLGCTCTDQDYGMQILCAVAPLDKLSPSYFVPVEFQVPSTSFFMGCGKSKIKLDSIRWPVTRYTSPNSKAKSSPVAEAALWVRPMCSSEGIDVACVETFKLAGCFPYCMALWTKGYTGSLVLRSGNEWKNTVSMVSRDCGLHNWDLKSGEMGSTTDQLRANSGVKSTWMDAEVQLNSSHCVYAPNTFSRMTKSSTSSYSSYRSVSLTTQPFAFAGDLAFTAVNTVADTWAIDVQRIWGNQVYTHILCRTQVASSFTIYSALM